MSTDREALLERFRAGLLARVARVDALLDAAAEDALDEGARRGALGELHTLKGEARMLGLAALAELTHALEARLAKGPVEAVVLRALDGMKKALGEGVDPVLGATAVEAALIELSDTPVPGADADEVEARPPEDGEPAPENGASKESNRSAPRRFVQVDAAVVDLLCERMAELSVEFGKLRARAAVSRASAGEAAGRASLMEDFARCGALVADATTRAWALRLVSVEPVLRELRRHARTLAAEHGKQVRVTIEARSVELERDVLDQLWDSLLHLVQNSIDHGLETPEQRADKSALGALVLSARSVGSSVRLSVEDDGRGIDPELLREAARENGRLSASMAAAASDDEILDLLFDHGFSTRREVSTLSGRGVGLAVVRQRLEALGGSVQVHSTPGRGTRFDLTVPFTITRERCLVIQTGAALQGFPARAVRAVLGADQLPDGRGEGRGVLRHQGETIPWVSLARALDMPSGGRDTAAVVVDIDGKHYALGIERVLGDFELIRRPAEALLGGLTEVAATALLEDGRLVLLFDLTSLKARVRAVGLRPELSAPAPVPAGARRRRVLVVDDSPVVTQVVKEILVSAGFSVEIVHDGTDALAALHAREPDLVLSDVEMPKMGGFELLAEIRKRNAKLPVVMLTTRGSVEDRQRATELGANAYLMKTGFKGNGLLDVIARFLPAPGGTSAALGTA